MSSGGGAQTTQSTAPPQWLQDFGRDYLTQQSQASQQPFQNYDGQRVAGLSPMTQFGMQQVGNLAGGTPYTDAAGGMLTQTLQGGGMNPYMTGVADRVTADATRAYNDATGNVTARFNRPGNFGGSAHETAQQHTNESFARGLGDALAPVYQSGYENERGRQMQAAGLSTGLLGGLQQAGQNAATVGDLDRQNMQSLLDSRFGDFTRWLGYPQEQLNNFGGALGRITGTQGQTATTNGPGPDRVSQGIGTIALGSMLGSGKGK